MNRSYFVLYLFTVLTILTGCTSELTQPTALVGGTAFSDPDSPPIEDAVILLEDGIIVSVGTRTETTLPRNAQVVDISGKSVLAGFWNAHVHFAEPVWENAATSDADSLSGALEEMALRWGFVRVVDTGSFLENTLALRSRIETGEVIGPDILTAGTGFTPPDGNPFYVEPQQLPQFTDPDQARKAVADHFDSRADLLKVFSGSPATPGSSVIMSPEILRAATGEAHANNRIVMAHPTDNEGLLSANEGGVDILAHTTPDGGEPWDPDLIAKMRTADVAVVPTLMWWNWALEQQDVSEETIEDFVAIALQQVRAYNEAGGGILFGTDVGFITEYDPTQEYVLLAEAGLSFRDILRALTTEPARRFGVAESGSVQEGYSADLVIVDGRPDENIRSLRDVSAVYLRGQLVFEASPGK